MSWGTVIALVVIGGVALLVIALIASNLNFGGHSPRLDTSARAPANAPANPPANASRERASAPLGSLRQLQELRSENRRLRTLLASFVWENRFITLNDEELVEQARRELGVTERRSERSSGEAQVNND
jgi:hypothetical protein